MFPPRAPNGKRGAVQGVPRCISTPDSAGRYRAAMACIVIIAIGPRYQLQLRDLGAFHRQSAVCLSCRDEHIIRPNAPPGALRQPATGCSHHEPAIKLQRRAAAPDSGRRQATPLVRAGKIDDGGRGVARPGTALRRCELAFSRCASWQREHRTGIVRPGPCDHSFFRKGRRSVESGREAIEISPEARSCERVPTMLPGLKPNFLWNSRLK